jgi:26S proteasome regulatory subunit (ATPase 3-interacting protein)
MLKNDIETMTKSSTQLKQTLQNLIQTNETASTSVSVTPELREKAELELLKSRKLWIQRRRMFREAWDAISEHMPGKPKEILEELGIETDEMIGVNISDIPEPQLRQSNQKSNGSAMKRRKMA